MGRHDAGVIGLALIEAVLDPSKWERGLRLMGEFTGASRGQLIAFDHRRTILLNRINDFAPEDFACFAASEGAYSHENWRIRSSGAPLEVISEQHYDRTRAQYPAPNYDALVREYDIPFGCQSLAADGDLKIGFAALRSAADGRTSEDDRAAFAALLPHAQAAIHMQLAIQDQGRSLITGALDTINAAAFLCDAEGRVGAMTLRAEELIRRGGGLQVTDHLLHATLPREDRVLQAAIAGLLGEPSRDMRFRRLWLSDGPELRNRMRCEMFRLAPLDFAIGFNPVLLITVRLPEELAAADRHTLAQLLGLTLAEADVAMLLADGICRDEIADRRATSPATVRAQIKNIFSKAGVNREGQLVTTINRLLR